MHFLTGRVPSSASWPMEPDRKWVYSMGLSNRIGYRISSVFSIIILFLKNSHKLGYPFIPNSCKTHLPENTLRLARKSRCREDVCRWHVGADGAELSGHQRASHGTCGEALNMTWIFAGWGSCLRFLLNIEWRAHMNRVLVLALDGFDYPLWHDVREWITRHPLATAWFSPFLGLNWMDSAQGTFGFLSL